MTWIAPWTLEAGRLEQTLSAVRSALSGRGTAPSLSFKPAALVGPLQDLGSKTATLLEAISAALKTRGSLGSSPWIKPADEMATLATMVASIREAWCQRVAATIDSSSWPVLASLLDGSAPNILAILGRESDENSHSDVLRWLLSPRSAPRVAPLLLQAVAARLEPAAEWAHRISAAIETDCISVRREVRMGPETDDPNAADRIDILVTGPGFTLAIENKIWSAEHDNQTKTYARWLAALPNETLGAGIFLTPRGHPAASPVFRPLSYLELANWLLDAAERGSASPAERVILAGYMKSLSDHVLLNEIRAIPLGKETT